jgi:hypothetical protein
MTGITWPVAFDASKFFTASNTTAESNVLLPTCKEGEDPFKNKCIRYVDPLELDPDPLKQEGVLNAPILFVSLWYDIGGVSFGTTYSYRVNGFQIVHGKKFPEVTIKAQDLFSTILNQDYHDIAFPEGTSVEEAVKKITDKAGFNIKLCNTNYASNPRIIPEYKRLKAQTLGEALEKVLSSVNGDMVYMPTKEFTKNATICTRSKSEVSRGCYIFYLGKGLYQGYEVEASFEPNRFTANIQQPNNTDNTKESGVGEEFDDKTYTLDEEIAKKPTRQSRFARIEKVTFPTQFLVKAPKVFGDSQTVTDKIWQEAGPIVQTKIGKDMNLYGVNPSGSVGKSYLDGRVIEANPASGEVTILTNYLIKFCRNDSDKKCFQAKIVQEIKGLEAVNVSSGSNLFPGQIVGYSSKEIFKRFIIKSSKNNQTITLNPEIVWKYAFPEDNRPAPGTVLPQANPLPLSQGLQSTPSQPETPTIGPPPGYQPRQKCTKAYVGQTGRTRNGDPANWIHVHVDEYAGSGKQNVEKDSLLLIRSWLNQGVRVLVGSGSTPEVKNTMSDEELLRYIRSGMASHTHSGKNAVDIFVPPGTAFPYCLEDIENTGGRDGITGLLPYGSYGGHLDPKSLRNEEAPVATQAGGFGSSSDRVSQFNGAAQTGISIETEFMGVPRALRIVPGRTLLYFVTKWDEWVEAGGHRGVKTNIDPGVWITKKYAISRIDTAEYQWQNGNLTVKLKATSAWGYLGADGPNVPDFETYLALTKRSAVGEFSDLTTNYLGYIRSAGTLCYPTLSGGDSCSEGGCEAIEAIDAFLTPPESPSGTDGNLNPGGVPNPEGAFPAANCRTGNPVEDQIINALYASGMRTPNAFAGVLGSTTVESAGNWNVHNTAGRGKGCATTPSRILGQVGYGIVQWCGSRADELATKYGCGRNCTLSQQVSFLSYELDRDYKSMIQKMNNAKTPDEAALIFREEFERPSAQDQQKRIDGARAALARMKCDRPST